MCGSKINSRTHLHALMPIYITGFMKKVQNISTSITLISPWFHPTFKQPPSHVNGQKIKKGRQCKGDKQVKKENKGLTLLLFFISSPLESLARKKRPLRARYQFLSTVFINPDIYILNIIGIPPGFFNLWLISFLANQSSESDQPIIYKPSICKDPCINSSNLAAVWR